MNAPADEDDAEVTGADAYAALAERLGEASGGPELAAALEERGYSTLTPVQEAVLAPELAGRDLRISSQTGSGKTVALGFVVRDVVTTPPTANAAAARPRVLVIVPTRELAKQVETELAWLFARLGVRVASVTGGASYRLEHRALAANPAIVVGTPGRLLDHLQRGSIEGGDLGAVVLDEADRMFDMGFQEDLEAIFGFAPAERRTHLVSATFPREVLHLADRVQRTPAHVEATPLGAANADIVHVAHFVEADRRLDALVNLLLAAPGERTIVFGKTRADVAQVTDELAAAGFFVASLSGEMEQRERNRAIEGFREGRVRVLVATDVAARGIDVQNVAQVVHLEPPSDADTYTHRSGRTGRAGNKGRSVMLVTRGDLFRAQRVAKLARITGSFEPLPTAESLRVAEADRIVAELTAPAEAGATLEPRLQAVVERLIAAGALERTLARLVVAARVGRGPAPREVSTVPLPNERARRPREPRPAPTGAPRGRDTVRQFAASTEPGHFGAAPARFGAAARASGGDDGLERASGRPPRTLPPSGWVAFRVTWGASHGADARRLLAMACRRGDIASGDVGRIHIGRFASEIEVASEVAGRFETSASRPDPRDPRVRIERQGGHGDAPRAPRPPRFDAPPPPRRGAPTFEGGPAPRSRRGPPPAPPRGKDANGRGDGPPKKPRRGR